MAYRDLPAVGPRRPPGGRPDPDRKYRGPGRQRSGSQTGSRGLAFDASPLPSRKAAGRSVQTNGGEEHSIQLRRPTQRRMGTYNYFPLTKALSVQRELTSLPIVKALNRHRKLAIHPTWQKR